MELEIKALHCELPEGAEELIEQKIARLRFIEPSLMSLRITIQEDNQRYLYEAHLHFRWGRNEVIKEAHYMFRDGVDAFIRKLASKVRKEKDRIQDKGLHDSS